MHQQHQGGAAQGVPHKDAGALLRQCRVQGTVQLFASKNHRGMLLSLQRAVAGWLICLWLGQLRLSWFAGSFEVQFDFDSAGAVVVSGWCEMVACCYGQWSAGWQAAAMQLADDVHE